MTSPTNWMDGLTLDREFWLPKVPNYRFGVEKNTFLRPKWIELVVVFQVFQVFLCQIFVVFLDIVHELVEHYGVKCSMTSMTADWWSYRGSKCGTSFKRWWFPANLASTNLQFSWCFVWEKQKSIPISLLIYVHFQFRNHSTWPSFSGFPRVIGMGEPSSAGWRTPWLRWRPLLRRSQALDGQLWRWGMPRRSNQSCLVSFSKWTASGIITWDI